MNHPADRRTRMKIFQLSKVFDVTIKRMDVDDMAEIQGMSCDKVFFDEYASNEIHS